jgi:hypothetical protein
MELWTFAPMHVWPQTEPTAVTHYSILHNSSCFSLCLSCMWCSSLCKVNVVLLDFASYKFCYTDNIFLSKINYFSVLNWNLSYNIWNVRHFYIMIYNQLVRPEEKFCCTEI